MDITPFGFEPGTTARILVVVVTTTVLLAFITTIARRWNSYWWVSIAFVVASCAALALGAFLSVRILRSVFDDMAITGGGIGTVWFGIWQATQPALAAAWLGILATLLASVFALPRASREMALLAGGRHPRAAIFASLAAIALAVGVTPALLFRRAVDFVLWIITPRAHPGGVNAGSVSQDIATRLLVTATVSAGCFLILLALVVITAFLARRSNPSRALFIVTVFALVANLGLHAALVTNLHSFAQSYRTAALMGQMPSK